MRMRTWTTRANAWLLAAAIVAPLMGCASSGQPVAGTAMPRGAPDWVRRESGAFNDGERVFYGVGSASGIADASLRRETATARARAAVAQSVQAQMQALVESYQSSIGDTRQSEAGQSIEATLRQYTDQSLTGVRIVNYWEDPRSMTLFALARLDLAQVAETIERAGQLDARVREFIRANAQRAFDRMDALRRERQP